MWFKNVKAYQITQPLSLDEGDLERALNEHAFRPCGSQDLATMGFASPFSQAGKQGTMFHVVQQRFWITLKKQEKILPGAVVNAELDEMVAKIEMETGSPVGKKAKADLKQEIQTRLLPQAFTKNTYTPIGSLPVVPFTRRSLQSELTHWVTESTPEGVGLLEEAELKSTDDTGSVIRCKNQPLDSEEISIHLDAGKLVQKVAFEYAETLTAIICEDGAIKRIKFTDRIKEETDDVPKDQVEARLDAEFALMSAEICTLLNFLRGALNLNDDSL